MHYLRFDTNNMNKYQVTIRFEMNEEFMSLVPEHRAYINTLIQKNIIEYYAVSMESYRVWILMQAENKQAIIDYLAESPLFRWWKVEIDQLFVYDSLHYRLPELTLN